MIRKRECEGVTVNVYTGCCRRSDFPPDRRLVLFASWSQSESVSTMKLTVNYTPADTAVVDETTVFLTADDGTSLGFPADPAGTSLEIPGLDPALYTMGSIQVVDSNAAGDGPPSNDLPIPPALQPPTEARTVTGAFWLPDSPAPSPSPVPGRVGVNVNRGQAGKRIVVRRVRR